MAAKPFHLGWFLGNSYGVHGWKQPWGGTDAQDWSRPDLCIDLARACERASFDFLLLEDSVFVPDQYGSSRDFYLERALRVGDELGGHMVAGHVDGLAEVVARVDRHRRARLAGQGGRE